MINSNGRSFKDLIAVAVLWFIITMANLCHEMFGERQAGTLSEHVFFFFFKEKASIVSFFVLYLS